MGRSRNKKALSQGGEGAGRDGLDRLSAKELKQLAAKVDRLIAERAPPSLAMLRSQTVALAPNPPLAKPPLVKPSSLGPGPTKRSRRRGKHFLQ